MSGCCYTTSVNHIIFAHSYTDSQKREKDEERKKTKENKRKEEMNRLKPTKHYNLHKYDVKK